MATWAFSADATDQGKIDALDADTDSKKQVASDALAGVESAKAPLDDLQRRRDERTAEYNRQRDRQQFFQNANERTKQMPDFPGKFDQLQSQQSAISEANNAREAAQKRVEELNKQIAQMQAKVDAAQQVADNAAKQAKDTENANAKQVAAVVTDREARQRVYGLQTQQTQVDNSAADAQRDATRERERRAQQREIDTRATENKSQPVGELQSRLDAIDNSETRDAEEKRLHSGADETADRNLKEKQLERRVRALEAAYKSRNPDAAKLSPDQESVFESGLKSAVTGGLPIGDDTLQTLAQEAAKLVPDIQADKGINASERPSARPGSGATPRGNRPDRTIHGYSESQRDTGAKDSRPDYHGKLAWTAADQMHSRPTEAENLHWVPTAAEQMHAQSSPVDEMLSKPTDAELMHQRPTAAEVDFGGLSDAFDDHAQSNADLHQAHLDNHGNVNSAQAATRTIHEVLDYALTVRGIAVVLGTYRIGKSFSAQAWAQQHLGEARYVQLTSASDDGSFFRDIARSLGVACGVQVKAAAIRLRVEEVLRAPHLLLIIDECEYILPQAVNLRAAPERVNWLMTSVVNNGVSVALIGSKNFTRMLAHVEKRSKNWGGEQFHGRIKIRRELLDSLEPNDLEAIAKVLLPGSDEAARLLLVSHALRSQGYVAALESGAARASYFAAQQGASVAYAHVKSMMEEAGTAKVRPKPCAVPQPDSRAESAVLPRTFSGMPANDRQPLGALAGATDFTGTQPPGTLR